MTIAKWPSDLPQCPIVDGFRSGPRGSRLATTLDSGPPKIRRRGPKLRTISLAQVFSADQRARFDRFWEDEIGCGTKPFLLRDPHLAGLRLCDDAGHPVTDQAGDVLTIESWILCAFSTDDPTWSKLPGGKYAPQFQIIELP